MAEDNRALNERQWTYMEALYYADQKAEEVNRSAWSRWEKPRPASEWRWIAYDHGPLGEDSDLQAELRRAGVLDPGAGSTWAALAGRGLVLLRRPHVPVDLGIASGYVQVVDVQITREGRRLIRERLGEKAPRQVPAGTLREWHWRALVLAYRCGEYGVPRCLKRDMVAAAEQGKIPSDDPWGTPDYGGMSWDTWLRLRDYKAGALAEEFVAGWRPIPQSSPESIYRIRLTSFGREYCRREHARYRRLYPDVDAPAIDDAEKRE